MQGEHLGMLNSPGSSWPPRLCQLLPGVPGPQGLADGAGLREAAAPQQPSPPGTHRGGTAGHHDNCQRSWEASSASFISDIINHALPGQLPGCDTIPGGPHPPGPCWAHGGGCWDGPSHPEPPDRDTRQGHVPVPSLLFIPVPIPVPVPSPTHTPWTFQLRSTSGAGSTGTGCASPC